LDQKLAVLQEERVELNKIKKDLPVDDLKTIETLQAALDSSDRPEYLLLLFIPPRFSSLFSPWMPTVFGFCLLVSNTLIDIFQIT
jgi:hypothetical protein